MHILKSKKTTNILSSFVTYCRYLWICMLLVMEGLSVFGDGDVQYSLFQISIGWYEQATAVWILPYQVNRESDFWPINIVVYYLSHTHLLWKVWCLACLCLCECISPALETKENVFFVVVGGGGVILWAAFGSSYIILFFFLTKTVIFKENRKLRFALADFFSSKIWNVLIETFTAR